MLDDLASFLTARRIVVRWPLVLRLGLRGLHLRKRIVMAILFRNLLICRKIRELQLLGFERILRGRTRGWL